MDRLVEARIRPMKSLQYLLELQRDWARGETYVQTMDIARVNCGASGLRVIYAKTMFAAAKAHRSPHTAVDACHESVCVVICRGLAGGGDLRRAERTLTGASGDRVDWTLRYLAR
jgi:hypothetical protein